MTALPARSTFQQIVRFAIELALLGGLGLLGWALGGGGVVGVLLAMLFVIAGAAVWGTFRLREESPGGRAPVAVSGPVRLAIELVLIALAIYGVWTGWSRAAAETLLTLVVVHMVLTWERYAWMVGVRRGG